MTVKLTPEAMRAARAILGLSIQTIAPKIGVSPTTINQVEKGEEVRLTTERKIIEGLAALNVEVLNGDHPGARLLSQKMKMPPGARKLGRRLK